MNSFQSTFSDRLSSYLKLRCGLGYHQDPFVFQAFDKYVHQRGYTGPLTQELALDFASENPNSSINYRASRYQFLRHFADYLATFDPLTPSLDPKALRRAKARPHVHAYTDKELADILREARIISLKNPIRGITLHAMIGLAACTGLRIGEVIHLDKTDLDLERERLIVRQTKFGKDRYIPLHPTAIEVIRNYSAVRDVAFPGCKHVAFFVNMRQRRFSPNTVQTAFCKLARRLGFRAPKGRGASFHGLRHRFAATRLVSWYKAGLDVQAMLPALATYMGHAHYTDTAYYLKATAELLGMAAGLYHQPPIEEKDSL
ncbi:MAG: tyrosine-type recombinase/integrase [Armatimonadetes bacterium]|nr:tyrosine-type recombinase/integrase [Armatimonadota bacterium]